jgi:hypothetical protein
MADVQKRDQSGAVPGPRHAPDGDQETGDAALAWSVTAMSDALLRLAGASAADMPHVVAAATEAVWWVTIVDAAMTRHHPRAYGGALAALDPAARRAVERSAAGLRFIRGQLGYSADPGDFIQRQTADGTPVADWTWRHFPPPSPRHGTGRDTSPYREYRAQLAGRPLAEALSRVADFLAQAHATAAHTGHRSPASSM